VTSRRLSVKFFRLDQVIDSNPYWRWFDAVMPPRVGEAVLQPRSTAVYTVVDVTWVEVDEVHVVVTPISKPSHTDELT